METAKMIGKTLILPGYGTSEGKQAKGKVIAVDNRHATLEFTDPKSKKTASQKFRLTDGMGVGSVPDTGVRISPEDLASLNGKEARKPKPASSKPSLKDGEKAATGSESETAPRARRAKDDVKIAATEWFPAERIRIGGKPPAAGDGQARLRISSRGFGATLKMAAFSHTKGESAEKKHFVDQWRAFVDKRWIFVYLDVPAAQYFWSDVGSIISQEGAPARALKTIVRDLKSAFPKTLKGDPIPAAPAKGADKPADEKSPKTKPGKSAPPSPETSQSDEAEEEETEEEEEVENPDASEESEDDVEEEEELEEVEETD